MTVLRAALAGFVLLSLCSPVVFAQVPADAEQRAELRSRIGAERETAEALYHQQMTECAAKFVVSSCAEAARKQRHDSLKRLRSEEAAIDDFERTERATERREAIAKKQAEDEAHHLEAEGRERTADSHPAAADKRSLAPAVRESQARKGKAPPSPQERAAQEASARAAYALKQLQAEARRQEAARRSAEYAKKAKPAAPLPEPGEEASPPNAASGVVPTQPASAASAP